jgi:hypothetical protein
MSEAAHNLPAVADEPRAPRLPNIPAGGAVRAIVPQDFEGAWRVAQVVVRAGMAPKGLDQPEKAMVAIMHGMEIGLTPMNAMQSIAVVNGRPTVWGDAAIGLARGSGLLEWMRETFEGPEGTDGFTAVCLVKRKGDPEPLRGEFSIADAKISGLWTKRGRDGQPTPWQLYPKRMLKVRARAFALRDAFADILKGIGIREEMEDVERVAAPEATTAPITPPSPPSPPSPPPAEPEVIDAEVVEPSPPAAPARPTSGIRPAPTPEELDIPAELDRRPKPAAEVPETPARQWPALPSTEHPEAWLAALDTALASFTDDQGELANEWFEQVVELQMDGLFPPDQDEAQGIWRKHERRWG